MEKLTTAPNEKTKKEKPEIKPTDQSENQEKSEEKQTEVQPMEAPPIRAGHSGWH